MQDIARIAGVSPATVSLVLNNRPGIADETRQKVLEVAKELKYKRRTSRRNGNDGNLLALVMEELPMPVFADSFCGTIVSGINEAAQEAGYHVVLAIVKSGSGTVTQVPPIIASGEAAGAIILGGGDLDDEFLIRVAEVTD